MHGIILAAGRGSRLKALTEEKPKCLTPLLSRPLIQWQVECLKSVGIAPLAICTGYQSEKLLGIGDHKFHNPHWANTNMVSTLLQADAWLQNYPTLVAYSDIVYRPEIIQSLMHSTGDISITYDRLWRNLWSLRFQNPLSDAETFVPSPSGYLLEIGNRTENITDIQGQYMGLLKFSPNGWANVSKVLSGLTKEEISKLDMTSLLKLLLKREIPIQTVAVEGGWCEVDSEEDLRAYESRVSQPPKWTHDWRSSW